MNKEEQVMRDFRDVFNKMVWLNKVRMEDCLQGYTPSEVHCIEYIGKNTDPNVTKLAQIFYLTRSATSKITKKLMEKGCINSYRRPENKKEIYFRLTEKGQEIFAIHEELHKEFRERDHAVFAQVTEAQFEGMLDFLERYSRHLDGEINKLGIEIGADSSE